MGNWVEKKLSEVCHISIGGTPSRAVSEYWDQDGQTQNFWVSIKDMNQKMIAITSEKISEKGSANSNAKLVKKGTVLLSFKLSIGKVSIAGNDLFTNEAIAALEAFGIDNQFLFHGLHKWDLLQDVDQAVKGATLNKEKLKKIKFTIPESKDEQNTIATVLTNIDQAIEKTEQLIAKYERIKTGLMQDLLTRGIDEQGNVRTEETHEFKDSVLGRIPREWEVMEFEKVSEKILVGIATSSSDSFTTQEHGILFLRNQNIKSNRIDLSDVAYISKRFAHANKSKFIKEGDVLTVRTGYPGISAVVPKDLEGSQTFTTLITRLNLDLVLPQYATIWLNSDFGKFQVKNLQGGGAQQNLNAGALKKITLKKPTIDEQKMIIQRLDSLEEIIEKYNQEFFKLQMSKTALMQDLLTGKVRVDALMNQVAQTI